MASLYFRYSTMNAGKSLDLLKVAHNYEERHKKALILTSALDDRYGQNKVKSRLGVEKYALGVKKDDNILLIDDYKLYDCVLVDEVQFFTKYQIYQLSDIVDYFNIPVICYGLRSDFKNEPFEGSLYLMTIADKIEELRSICWCGAKASINCRINDNEIVYDGNQVKIGGNESYITLCRKHYKEGKMNK